MMAKTTESRPHFFNLTAVLKVLFSGALVGWLVARNDMRQILQILESLSPGILAAVVLLYLGSMIINAVKWRLLLDQRRLRDLFVFILIAQYYSMLFPGQIAGEAVKVYKLGRLGHDTEKIAASVAVDRLTGLMAVVLVALAGIAVSRNPVAEGFALWMCLALAGILSGTYFLYHPRIEKCFKRLALVLLRPVPRANAWVRPVFGFIDAWRVYLKRPGLMLRVVAVGVVLQLVCVVINLVIARQVGIDVSFADWCWIFGIVSMVVFLPVTFGGLGLREGGFVLLLSFFNVPGEKALALSFTVFAIQLLGALVGGLVDFGLSWKGRK
jgi:uncharacterized protein (TIRG00374 family)